jgi:hypothetical protein
MRTILDSRLRGNDNLCSGVSVAQIADARSEAAVCKGPRAALGCRPCARRDPRSKGMWVSRRRASPGATHRVTGSPARERRRRPATSRVEASLDPRLRGNDTRFSGVAVAQIAGILSQAMVPRGLGEAPRRTQVAATGGRLGGNASAAYRRPACGFPWIPACAGMTTSSRASPLLKSRTLGAKEWCARVQERRHVRRRSLREEGAWVGTLALPTVAPHADYPGFPPARE